MGEPAGWDHQQGWPSQTRHIGEARAFVRYHLGSHGLLNHADVITLVVSELATNAVIHTKTPFTVVLALRDSAILLEVRDNLPGSLRALPALHTNGLHGRGLHIVQTLSTSWGVWSRRDGKSVWASFTLVQDGTGLTTPRDPPSR